MLIGYNTNGVAFHDPLQAIDLLGDIGYQSLAITIDHQWLNPYSDNLNSQIDRISKRLDELRMRSVIETGARFLLDPQAKHQPTLLTADPEQRNRRVDFLKRCIDIARRLRSDCVSLWSGSADDQCDAQTALDRLGGSLRQVLDYAHQHEVVLGFEPEPGMFVETTGEYSRLRQWVESDHLKLTMDIGHLFCLGEVPIAGYIHEFRDLIVNVHMEDMKAGVHDHLMFGDGQISFPPVIRAFKEINYQGTLHVELSRHSHDAARVARKSFDFLSSIVNSDITSSH